MPRDSQDPSDKPTLIRVFDLIALLKTCPPDALVVLSRDPEGNKFSPMDSYGAARGKVELGHQRLFNLTGDGTPKKTDAIVLYPAS